MTHYLCEWSHIYNIGCRCTLLWFVQWLKQTSIQMVSEYTVIDFKILINNGQNQKVCLICLLYLWVSNADVRVWGYFSCSGCKHSLLIICHLLSVHEYIWHGRYILFYTITKPIGKSLLNIRMYGLLFFCSWNYCSQIPCLHWLPGCMYYFSFMVISLFTTPIFFG